MCDVVCQCIFVCDCVGLCICACLCVCVRACLCMHACLRACVHACVRACVRLCVCACVRKFIRTQEIQGSVRLKTQNRGSPVTWSSVVPVATRARKSHLRCNKGPGTAEEG